MADPGTPVEKHNGTERQGRIGHFIQTYSSFLSSFVIGVAGLIATSLYQWNQSQVANRQATSQQRIAETQADNSWKIERAKILSDNLKVLTAQGGDNTEQKYGVLLSLTRGSILDPELAVSYALELGKENPEYMRSVLANTQDKDYRRLLSAFDLTCEQRYGLSRQSKACAADKNADRSMSLAELILDDTDQALQAQEIREKQEAADQQDPAAVAARAEAIERADRKSPLLLLKDEREVHANLSKLLWFFTPFLNDLFERRQWDEIDKFEKQSAGARLVASLVLLAAHNGEFAAKAEAAVLSQKSEEQRGWLTSYLLGASCNAECKARAAGYMLTEITRAGGNFDGILHAILVRPHSETVATVTRLNTRFMLCQVTPEDGAALRDEVLVPALGEQLDKKPPDPAIIDEISGLLALTPDPAPPKTVATTPAPVPVPAGDPKAIAAYRGVLATLQKAGAERYQHFLDRRAQVQRARFQPTVKMKKSTFCLDKADKTAEPDVKPDEG